MATISSINAAQLGAFVAAITTLSADDIITVDGSDGTTVNFPGAPGVSVAAGYAIAVPAGESRAVVLSTISAYCKGVVHLTGAATLKAQLFNL